MTFSAKNLYDHLISLIEWFYEQFSGNQLLDKAAASLDIIYGWGGRRTGDGIYYRITQELDEVPYRTYNQAADAFPGVDDKQEAVAAEVRDTGAPKVQILPVTFSNRVWLPFSTARGLSTVDANLSILESAPNVLVS